MNKHLTELIGTFFLVLTVGLAGAHAGNLAPLAIGSVLMVMVYMGGHVSGAHYNPAVTLGVFLRGRLKAPDLAAYMVAQFVGGILGAFTVVTLAPTHMAPPKPGDVYGIFGPLLAEILFTFALVLVVLNVATSKDHPNNSFYGLAIGFTVLAGAYAVGPVSGGVFNPAVGLGPILVDTIWAPLVYDSHRSGGEAFQYLWFYLLGPFGGGALAGLMFLIQNPNDK